MSPPTLTSTSPADNATGVALDSNITLTFNETVVAGSGNITLFKSDNTQVEAIAVGLIVTVLVDAVTADEETFIASTKVPLVL